MKKLSKILIWSLFLSLLFFIVGCGKDEIPVIPPVNAPTITVSANPTQLPKMGSSSLISIMTTNAESATSDLPGFQGISGSFPTPNLYVTTTYHFKVYGKGGVAKDSITIFVGISPAPTIVVSANLTNLPYGGGTVVIGWTTTNTDSVLYKNVWYPSNDTMHCFVTKETVFTFIARGPGGENFSTITIKVEQTPPPTPAEVTLCLFPKKLIEVKFSYTKEGDPYAIMDFSALCEQDDQRIFYLNHIVTSDMGEIFCDGETIRYLSWNWSLVGSILKIGGLEYDLLVNTEDGMVDRYESIQIQPDGVSVIKIWVTETLESVKSP